MSRVTRSSNALARPGKPDLPRSRRKKEEVVADNVAKEAAKQAEQAEKAKSKKQKEDDLAEMQMALKKKEDCIRELRVLHSMPASHPLQPSTRSSADAGGRSAAKSDTSASTGKSAGAKRKRQPESEEPEPEETAEPAEGQEDELEEETSSLKERTEDEMQVDEPEEPPTPSPPRRATRKSKSSELSELEPDGDDVPVEKTPRPARKRSKNAAPENMDPSPESVANAKARLIAPDDPASGAKIQPIKRPLPRTVAVPATPFMQNPGKSDVEGNARGSGPKPRPKGTSTKSKPSSKEKQPHNNPNIKREPISDTEIDNGGFGKTDDELAEAAAAKASPVKSGGRVTSAAMVKTEDVDLATPSKPKKPRVQGNSTTSKTLAEKKAKAAKTAKVAKAAKAGSAPRSTAGSSHDKAIELDDDDDDDTTSATASKPRATAKNADLPKGVHEHSRWKAKFIPTLFKAMGASEDPWNMSDRQFVKLLQLVWNAVYDYSEKLSMYLIEENDAVHGVATQRVYEWRSSFGSSAMRSYEAFFNSYAAEFSDAISRHEFCKNILRDGRLFYLEPESSDKEGLYRSPFVLAGMVGHIDAIQGAISVPGLFDTPEKEHPYAAIGLAAAGAYRVAALWYLKKLALDEKGSVFVVKTRNRVTGKMSTKESDFSHANFSNKTTQCMTSARKLQSRDIDEIVAAAYVMAQLPPPSAPTTTSAALTIDFDFDFGELTQD
ncbi:hypothetical protein TRAPUB_5523 [Trametes pubescens]|uniref:Uncharacterized protein n=1 Tax=Trametes pubescens TaxID=154538 RepID=A0A1M2V888_TRAPU|nr:hypothetical protein TRAPUB_5523 [Trametes pubescens]